MGYNDEVLDVKFFGKGYSHIVVATNSPQLKVFELASRSCQILYGHTGQLHHLGAVFTACRLRTGTKDSSFRKPGVLL